MTVIYRYKCQLLLLAFSLMAMLVSCAPFMVRNYSGGYDGHTVRILVLKTKDMVNVSSHGDMKLYKNKQMFRADEKPNSTFAYNPQTMKDSIIIEPANETLLLNGNPYRGTLTIYKLNDIAIVVNTIRMDEYLISVVPGEIPANWDHEALKAQAIAARSFTYYHLAAQKNRDSLYDLDATAASQVYRGMIDEKPQTSAAVKETSGLVMIHDEKPILSYFHSTCGGKTIDDRYVWEKSRLPYLKGTRCGFCGESTKYTWESVILLDEIRECLKQKNPAMGAIRNISFKRKDDRVIEVSIQHSQGAIRMSGNNFRLLFPADKIRSLYFTSKKITNGLELKGHGWGHGVGLCQWGARGMALRGYKCADILNHYYTGVKITNIRNAYLALKPRNGVSYQ